MKHFTIAIDGPAGSGKSTVAKKVAAALGLIYMDTGAMYRTVAYACLKQEINLEDETAVCASLQNLKMDIILKDGKQRICLDGEDVTELIRSPQIGKGASAVGKYLPVREYLVRLQQSLAKGNDVIMDGRDIGTKVLPEASLKIYLDASVQERAKRRMGELDAMGKDTPAFEELCKQMQLRDKQDMEREHSPLVRAEDAVYLDTTGLNIEQVTEQILQMAKKIRNEV